MERRHCRACPLLHGDLFSEVRERPLLRQVVGCLDRVGRLALESSVHGLPNMYALQDVRILTRLTLHSFHLPGASCVAGTLGMWVECRTTLHYFHVPGKLCGRHSWHVGRMPYNAPFFPRAGQAVWPALLACGSNAVQRSILSTCRAQGVWAALLACGSNAVQRSILSICRAQAVWPALLACGSNSIQCSASNPTNSEDEVKNIFVQFIESGYFTTTKMTLILYNALSSPKDHILLSCYNYKILLQIQEPLTSHLTENIN